MSISDDFIKEALGVSPKKTTTESVQQSPKTAGSSIADDFIRMAHYDVDENFINTFMSDANRFMSSANDDYSKIGWGNASSSYESRRSAWADLDYRNTIVRGWLDSNKDRLGDDTYKEFSASLDNLRSAGTDILGAFSGAKDYYSQWANEEDYNSYQEQQQNYEKLIGLDLDAAQKEIDDLEKELERYQYLVLTASHDVDKENTELLAMREKYGHDGNIRAMIKEKTAYLNQAKRAQEEIALYAMSADEIRAKMDSATDRDDKLYYWNILNQKIISQNAEILANSYMDGSNKSVLDEMKELAKMKNSPEKKQRKEAVLQKMEQLGVGTADYALYAGDSNVTWDGFWDWLGAAAGSGLSSWNKAITGTADYLIGRPLQGMGWKNNPISSMADYYSDSYEAYRSKLELYKNRLGGGKGWDTAGQLVEGTIAAIPDALLAIMTAGSSKTATLANTAEQATGNILTRAGVTVESMAHNPQFWLSYARSYSSDYEAAKAMGADDTTAAFGATISSLINAGIEIGPGGTSGIQGLPNEVKQGGIKAIVEWAKSSLEEGGEEVLQGFVNNAVSKALYDHDVQLLNPKEMATDFTMGTAVGSVLGGGQMAVGSVVNSTGKAFETHKYNNRYKKTYGSSPEIIDALVKEGLESAEGSKSHQLAQEYKRKIDNGKTLTGAQIRKLVEANDAQFAVEDYEAAVYSAEKRLTELGETNDVNGIAKLAAKRATGQELTRAEISTLARSQFGAQVAKEMTGHDESLYKPLENRMAAEATAQVSDTGKAVIRATGEEIDLTNPNFKEITPNGVVLEVDGKTVSSDEVDYDSEDQGLAINAIGKIEHITPAAASALYAKLDMTKPVMEQLNGMDEAFTYGFYNYSEADLKAGLFTGNLTKEQLNDAYKLGRYVAKNTVADNTAAIKKMRTASNTIAEQNAQGKETKDAKSAPKGKKLTITYNHGNGVIEDITTAEEKLNLNEEQQAAIEVAKLLHQMGLGTDFELFMSHTVEGEDGKPQEAFINDEGQEEAAYAGLYLAADGKIRINLNAYSGTKGLALNALSHELVHFIKTWSLEKYTTMAEFLTNAYGESGMTMHQRILREQARLKNIRKKDVGYDEAYDEVVANALNRMFDDGKVLEKLNELTVKDKGLVDKILEGIKRFFNRFLKVYQNNQSLFRDTEALMEMKEAFEQLQNMFAEALVDASANFQAAQGIVNSFVKDYKASHKGEQYSSQETDVDRTYIKYGDVATEKAAINKTVARLVSEGKFVRVAAEDVEKHKISGEWDSRKGARQHLKKILKGFLGKSVRFNHNIVRAEAYLTKEGFNHSAVGLNTPEKAAAFSEYYALIANSEYSYSSRNDTHSNANVRIGGKIDWDNFVSVAMIENEPYPVIFKVRTIDQDIRSQIYRMATKNEIGSTHDYGQQNNLPDALPNYGGTPISKNKVTQYNPEVNEKSSQSTQQTDNLTDRDMLANAFETISRSSAEYEMIQDYKSEVDLLNKLERELDGVNQEIRNIRFSAGKRDSQRLELLESKAKRLAKDITKYDKRLLNMEASAPLRKVIERERKKEAQRTKNHVKEIQQNKKVRAEQTELRHKIRKAVRDLDKILNRGNKKQNVKEDMKDFVSKTLELADYLFTDHISNDELIRKGITVRMTPREAAMVKETEDILSKLYDNADSLTDEEFTKLDAKRKANEEKLRDLLTAQRNERLNTPVAKLFDDLVKAYASLKNSNQDAVKAAYNEELENSLRAFMSDDAKLKILQNMRVADMTTEELNWLYRAYTMVLSNVRNANKFHVKGMNATIDQKVGRIVSDFSSRKIPDGKAAIVARNLANKMGWDYEKLYYALDRIGSEAFTELFTNLANSENIVMQDIIESMLFRDQMVEKYGFNNWSVNKEIDREFLDNTGKKFKLTLGQLMSLYAYSRRDGAWDHIEYGGFVFGKAAMTNPRPADSYKLSKEQCEAITSTLTKEQRAYVEEMQKFLSETMGEKGNEVSMLLYGIKMFGEKNYFPIRIAGQFKAQAQESQAKAAAGFGSMSNAGFTHAQNPNAKAPFVLEGFNEVWSDHVNDMSRYHGTVPALEDIRRVMNRSSYSDTYKESMSVKAVMENAFGKDAVDYFDNLYREANSGAITDKLQHTSKKLLSLFRKNSVAYSLSVLIQQPASLVRAYAMIDKKYFGFKGFGTLTGGVAKAVTSKWNSAYSDAYSEMLKYAPGVTMAKEIGGFDTATGGSIRSTLLDTGKSFKQKWKTGTVAEKGKAVRDVVDDNPIANLPNVADKIAWIEIWNACKRETVATHKDLAANSEEFMQAVGERFTEVIRATQVYDSIFAKSPMLKSKNLGVQYLVSFMNEPNTIANMVEKAVRDVTKGNWKQSARTAGVVIHSIIFTNLLKSMIYALRDDDEDETYTEKYIEAVVGNMMNDFNPLSYIPVARDVWSIAQGYDVERADMAIVADALDTLDRVLKNVFTDTSDMTEEELVEFDKKVTEANWKLVESLAAFFGIPVKNIHREINAFIDHARIASANAGLTTGLSISDTIYDAVVESIPFMSGEAKSKGDKLYGAIISGDKAYLARLKSGYKTNDAYQSAVRKALREHDDRVKEAAQAFFDEDFEKYADIFEEIRDERHFSHNDIYSAIMAGVAKLEKESEPEGIEVYTAKEDHSLYTAESYFNALVAGKTKSANIAYKSLIKAELDEGYLQYEAENNVKSALASQIGNAYRDGEISRSMALKLLDSYTDKGEIDVKKWDFQMEYGYSWGDRDRAYRKGAITESELIEAIMDVEGESEQDAQEYVRFIKLAQRYGDTEITANDAADYFEFVEPAEIDVRTYMSFAEKVSGLSSDKDANGKVTKSKKDKVLEVIDAMDLDIDQKDALYYAAGYAESGLYKTPWHRR